MDMITKTLPIYSRQKAKFASWLSLYLVGTLTQKRYLLKRLICREK